MIRNLLKKVGAILMLMCILVQTGGTSLASILAEENSFYAYSQTPIPSIGKKAGTKKAPAKSKKITKTSAPSLQARFVHPVEGQPANMIFELDRDATSDVTFKVTTRDGGGSGLDAMGCDAPTDDANCSYESYTDHLMTIPTGSREVILPIDTYDNDDITEDRYFTVTIHDVSANATIDDVHDEKVVTILDRNGSAVAPIITAMTVVSHPEEGTAAVIRLELNAPAPANVIAYITTSDGTGTDGANGGTSCVAGIDYISATRLPVTINAGMQSKDFFINTCDNSIVDGDRKFDVKIVDVLGCTIETGVVNPVEVIIRDNDTNPILTFTPTTPVIEGNPSVLTFTLDRPAVGDVTFKYATTGAGSARPGNDYAAVTTPIEVTIPSGQVAPLVAPEIQTNVGIQAPSVNFFVDLSSLSSNVTYPSASATEIVINRITMTNPVLTVTANPVIAGDEAQVVLALDKPPVSDVTVTLTTEDDSAIAGSDYEDIGTQTVTFTPDDWFISKIVPVTTNDIGQTAAVQFKVKVDAPSEVTYTGGDVVVVINPPATRANLTMSVNATSVVEGGAFTLTFTLDQVLSSDVDFKISTSDGLPNPADPVNDYDGLASEPVTISAGSLTKTILIQTKVNATETSDVNFNVDVDDGSVVGLANDLTSEIALTILDDSTAPVPNLTVTYPANVVKGNDAVLSFSLNQVPTTDVTFDVKTIDVGTGPGFAIVGGDLEAVDGTFTIVAGSTTLDVDISTFNTRQGEDNLVFGVEVNNVQNANDNTSSPFNITIKDPTVGGLPILTTTAPTSVIEGAVANVSLTLDRLPAPGVTASVNVKTIDGTASSTGGDYESKDEIVTFSATEGILTKVLPIQTRANTDGDRDFSVSFTSSEVTYTEGNKTITIIDEVAGSVPLLTVTATPNPVDEGQAVTLGFSINVSSSQSSIFRVKTADYTAINGDNYTGIPFTTVTIPAGSTSPSGVPVTVGTINDGIATGDTQFLVQIDADPSNGASNIEYQGSDVLVTITDIDAPVQPVVLSISNNTTPVEGNNAVITFTLTEPAPTGGVTFNISTRDAQYNTPSAIPGSAAAGDYSALVNYPVTIAAGLTSTTANVTTYDRSSTGDKWFNLMIVPSSITGSIGGTPLDVDVLIQGSSSTTLPTLRIAD